MRAMRSSIVVAPKTVAGEASFLLPLPNLNSVMLSDMCLLLCFYIIMMPQLSTSCHARACHCCFLIMRRKPLKEPGKLDIIETAPPPRSHPTRTLEKRKSWYTGIHTSPVLDPDAVDDHPMGRSLLLMLLLMSFVVLQRCLLLWLVLLGRQGASVFVCVCCSPPSLPWQHPPPQGPPLHESPSIQWVRMRMIPRGVITTV